MTASRARRRPARRRRGDGAGREVAAAARGTGQARRWSAQRVVWTVFTALFMLLAVGAVLWGVEEVVNTMHLRSRGAYAAAEILESAGGKNSYAVVRFRSADGKQITAKTEVAGGQELVVGHWVSALYDPADPVHNLQLQRAGRGAGFGGLFIPALSALVFGGGAAFALLYAPVRWG